MMMTLSPGPMLGPTSSTVFYKVSYIMFIQRLLLYFIYFFQISHIYIYNICVLYMYITSCVSGWLKECLITFSAVVLPHSGFSQCLFLCMYSVSVLQLCAQQIQRIPNLFQSLTGLFFILIYCQLLLSQVNVKGLKENCQKVYHSVWMVINGPWLIWKQA